MAKSLIAADVSDDGAEPVHLWDSHDGQLSATRVRIGADGPPSAELLAPTGPAWTPSRLAVCRRVGSRFELHWSDGEVLSGQAGCRPYRLMIRFPPETEILGFGAANGRATRNDSRFRILARDTLLYGIKGASYTALPCFVARQGAHCVGVLLLTAHPLDVEVRDGTVTISAVRQDAEAPVDFVAFRGSLAAIVSALTRCVGRCFLPPAWALGFHQSRWSYRSAEQVLEIARRFRAADLPADAIHLDIHYMDRYRVFTFDPRRFANPAAMHDALRGLGFRTMAIVDPGVSVAPYKVNADLHARGLLLQRSDGTPYRGRVWPGATVFPDLMRPKARECWAEYHTALLDAGVGGIWNDMNDPVFRAGASDDPLQEDVWHEGGTPHWQVRNLYANRMAEATCTALRKARPHERPFVLSRSGFLGIQRHAAVWTGDNHSSWTHLRENLDMVLNLGLSGVPLAGADVGGFGSGPGKLGLVKPFRPSAELYVRWMELGSLMPFFRAHTTHWSPGQEPWRFGPHALELVRQVLRRRYRLLPLLYRLAHDAHSHGLPIVRPLFMHHDVPPGCADGEFLLGEAVLAAPVFERGVRQRPVWLPEGDWLDWYSGEPHRGPCEIVTAAELGRTPLYVRAGAGLFLAEPGRNAEATLAGPLSLELAMPPAAGSGRASLFLDDGLASSGAGFWLEAETTSADGETRLLLTSRSSGFVPAQDDFELRAPARFGACHLDGRRLPLTPVHVREEGRDRRFVAARIPLAGGEIVLD